MKAGSSNPVTVLSTSSSPSGKSLVKVTELSTGSSSDRLGSITTFTGSVGMPAVAGRLGDLAGRPGRQVLHHPWSRRRGRYIARATRAAGGGGALVVEREREVVEREVARVLADLLDHLEVAVHRGDADPQGLDRAQDGGGALGVGQVLLRCGPASSRRSSGWPPTAPGRGRSSRTRSAPPRPDRADRRARTRPTSAATSPMRRARRPTTRPGTAVRRGTGRRCTESARWSSSMSRSPGRCTWPPRRESAPWPTGCRVACRARWCHPARGTCQRRPSESPPASRRSARAGRSRTAPPGSPGRCTGWWCTCDRWPSATGTRRPRSAPPAPVAWLYHSRSGLPATHLRDTKLAPAATVTLAGSVQKVPVSPHGLSPVTGTSGGVHTRSSTGEDAPIVLVTMSPANDAGLERISEGDHHLGVRRHVPTGERPADEADPIGLVRIGGRHEHRGGWLRVPGGQVRPRDVVRPAAVALEGAVEQDPGGQRVGHDQVGKVARPVVAHREVEGGELARRDRGVLRSLVDVDLVDALDEVEVVGHRRGSAAGWPGRGGAGW